MGSSIGFYHYHYDPIFYTGVTEQPDTVSLFVLPKEEGAVPLICHKGPISNTIGYFAFASIVSGACRVANAVEKIFKSLPKIKWEKEDPHLQECWNATKNLCRGAVEMIPLTGGFLFLFDLFRSKIFIQSEIQKELEDRKSKGQQTAGVGGIALDGKILFLIDINDLKEEKKKNDKDDKPEAPLTDARRLELLGLQLDQSLKRMEELRTHVEAEKKAKAEAESKATEEAKTEAESKAKAGVKTEVESKTKEETKANVKAEEENKDKVEPGIKTKTEEETKAEDAEKKEDTEKVEEKKEPEEKEELKYTHPLLNEFLFKYMQWTIHADPDPAPAPPENPGLVAVDIPQSPSNF